jgi:hypothetical protein
VREKRIYPAFTTVLQKAKEYISTMYESLEREKRKYLFYSLDVLINNWRGRRAVSLPLFGCRVEIKENDKLSCK